jgi:hypothetical protein
MTTQSPAIMNRHFFHFPLCLLSSVEDVRTGVDHIISYACVEVGKERWQKLSENERGARRSFLPDPAVCSGSVDLEKDEELQAVVGCEYLDVCAGNVTGMLASHAQLLSFIKEFERRHGTDARVRIRTDWLFEVRDSKGMSYKELAVLAAIYSKIGASKGPVRITQDEIRKRAHGFKSDRVFTAEMSRRRKALVTPYQVRSIIERLHVRKFFARVTYARRQTYYSNRLSTTELADHIFTAKTQRSRARQARISANADLTTRIQAERRKLAGSVATKMATDSPL